MKKTLLAVALLFVSTSIFAQVNQTTKDAQHQVKGLSHKIGEIYTPKAKKAGVKGTADGAEILTSFAEGTFTTGFEPNHSGQGEFTQWLRRDSKTAWTGSSSFMVNNFFGFNNAANWQYLNSEDYCNMSGDDGFMYIDFLSIQDVDHQNNAIFNAWVKADQSIKTYGKRGIDIYISQFVRKFNSDHYYVEWSHDEDFAVKDSIEFNLRDIDVNTNDYIMGTLRITLPTNTTNCPLISEDPGEDTWFRIRVICPPSANLPQGYLYLLDDLAWAETPEYRLDVLNCEFYGGFHGLPEMIIPEPFNVQLRVNNSGANDLYNTTVQNLMVQAEILEGAAYDGSDSLDYNFESSSVVINSGSQDVLSTDAYNTTGRSDINSSDTLQVLRDYEYLNAYSEPQLNNGVGYYGVKNKLAYQTEEGGTPVVVDASPYDYHYTVNPANEDGSYLWRRDAGTSAYYYNFSYGWSQGPGVVYIGGAETNVKGYKACLGFNATEYSEPVYAWGVNVYPAVDSVSYVNESNRHVKEGAMIKGSLWYYDPLSEDANSAVTPVLDMNDNPLESEPYTVQASDYNTLENADNYGRVSSLKPIYLPFATLGEPLEANRIYYACYEQVINGTFSIAENYNSFINVFFPGVSYVDVDGEEAGLQNVIVWSPNITQEGYNYPWGYPFNYQYTPFIRLVVSKQQASLKDVAQNTASVNLFPNPAKDNTVLDYTLATTGKVTVEVTDLMGRVVLSYNEGLRHAGVANKANIEANKLANGTYFCTVNVDGAKVSTTKMVVNK